MRGVYLRQLLNFLVMLILMSGCARETPQVGRSIPVKIKVDFSDSGLAFATEALEAGVISSGTSETSATSETAPTSTTSGTSGTSGTSAVSGSELARILTPPEKLINAGLTQFKVKRVFRWLSFKVNRGTQILKEGSIELRDPQLLELSPIELDALTGDSVSVAISLFQADFMTASDGDSLCMTGAPGFIRTWSGTTNAVVDQSGLLSVRLENAGLSTVHMAAVAFNADELLKFKAADSRHVLMDRLTGQKFEGELCKVHELPAAGTPAEFRFLKLMAFSQPLKSHEIGISSPQFSTFYSTTGKTDGWSEEADTRAASELGITLALKSSDNGDRQRLTTRVLPAELLGTSWEPERPEIKISNPSLTLVNSSSRVEFPIKMTANSRLNSDSLNIIQPASGPNCAARFVRTEDPNSAVVVLENCQGDGVFKFKLADGTLMSDRGTKSLVVESPDITVDNTAPSLSVISPPLESFVGSSFNISGSCEGGGSKVSLQSSDVTSQNVDCIEYTPNVYQFLFMVSASGLNGARDFKIIQADSSGNSKSIALNVIVDGLPPTLSAAQSVTAVRASGSVVYTFSAVDAPESSGGPFWDLSGISLVQSGTVSGCSKTVDSTNRTITVTACTGNGTVSLSLPSGVARDGIGNMSVAASSSGSVVVDNLGPSLAFTYPTATQWVNGNFTLTGTCEAGGSTVTVLPSSYLTATNASVTCGSGGNYSTNVSIVSGAADGSSHSVTVNQSDALGNSTSFTQSISLDRSPPTISVTPAGPVWTNTSSKTLTFTGSDSGGSGLSSVNVSGINVSNGSGVSGCGISRDTAAKTVTISGCSGDGSAMVSAPSGAARDAAGNDSVSYPSFVTLYVDNTPPAPTLSTLGTTTVYGTSVTQTLAGTCNTSDGNVELAGDVVTQSTSCTGGNYTFSSFQVTTGSGPKIIRVRQTDAAGNTGQSSAQTLTLVYPTAPNIASTLNFSGMGLRPSFTGTCDSTSGNVTTLTSTIGRAAYLNCTSGVLYGVLSLPFTATTETSGTITLTTTGPAGLSASADFTFIKDTPSCPVGFVRVRGLSTHINQLGNANAAHGHLRAWLDTGQDFCVMKFQAKENLSATGTIGLNYYSNAPWIDISRDQAMNKCSALCTSCSNTAQTIQGTSGSVFPNEMRGYRLISNTQWQVIARDIVQQTSNWTNNIIGGTGTLYQGHTDGGPANPVQNGPDNATEPTITSNAFHGIGEGSGPQRRVHYLSNGEHLFDFSGNAWQWVSDELTIGSGTSLGVGLTTSLGTTGLFGFDNAGFTSGNLQSIFGMQTTYPFNKLTGKMHIPATLGTAIVRGGFHGNGTTNVQDFGIFATDLSRSPSAAYANVSFRCVYIP